MTLRTRNSILSTQEYNPFWEEIRSYSRRGKFNDGVNDKYQGWSPYNYCMSNPLLNNDPEGRIVGFGDDKE
jgi:hypothetical protein